MNLNMCNMKCDGFTYFGMQNGNACWCGNAYNQFGVGTCNSKCSGSPDMTCGGPSVNSVYRVSQLMDTFAMVPSSCASCPTTDGALKTLHGASCEGGWYPPVAKKKYWSHKMFPETFFQCFKGVCDGGSIQGTDITPQFSGNWSQLQKCGSGAKGRMCAGCIAGTWKWMKSCASCPTAAYKYVIFLFAPVILLMYFPMLKHLIGGGIIPSLYVSNGFLQIIAVFGGFAIACPIMSQCY